MNDTKQYTSERSPEYLAATLREVAETLDDVGKTIDARLGAWAATPSEPKTVQCSGWTWTHIRRVTVRARSNGTLDTTITGVSNSGSGKEFDLHSARTTPAQVCQLCKRAGWEKPEVRMVLTYADGDPCEVDPCEDIGVEYDAHWHATSIAWVRRSRDNRYEHRIVREPVAVVEQMLAACKEGE